MMDGVPQDNGASGLSGHNDEKREKNQEPSLVKQRGRGGL